MPVRVQATSINSCYACGMSPQIKGIAALLLFVVLMALFAWATWQGFRVMGY
jgi:hypothetical protein